MQLKTGKIAGKSATHLSKVKIKKNSLVILRCFNEPECEDICELVDTQVSDIDDVVED